MGTTEKGQEAFGSAPRKIQRFITIERVAETVSVRGGFRSQLTERQREVIDSTIDLGYYAVPLRVTAADIGVAVGCAPSMASEHLRKIETCVLSELR